MKRLIASRIHFNICRLQNGMPVNRKSIYARTQHKYTTPFMESIKLIEFQTYTHIHRCRWRINVFFVRKKNQNKESFEKSKYRQNTIVCCRCTNMPYESLHSNALNVKRDNSNRIRNNVWFFRRFPFIHLIVCKEKKSDALAIIVRKNFRRILQKLLLLLR